MPHAPSDMMNKSVKALRDEMQSGLNDEKSGEGGGSSSSSSSSSDEEEAQVPSLSCLPDQPPSYLTCDFEFAGESTSEYPYLQEHLKNAGSSCAYTPYYDHCSSWFHRITELSGFHARTIQEEERQQEGSE